MSHLRQYRYAKHIRFKILEFDNHSNPRQYESDESIRPKVLGLKNYQVLQLCVGL